MTTGNSLHLYLRKSKEKFSFSSFLTNLFLPYLIFYISVLRLKQAVSIKEFMDEQYYRFFSNLCIYYRSKNKNPCDFSKDLVESLKKRDSNRVLHPILFL